MSDMADDFNAMRRANQEKRACNREFGAKLLTDSGVQFKSRNYGAHLIVEHGGNVVNYWPGTGKWIVAKGSVGSGRGIRSLLTWLKNNPGGVK